MIDPSPHYSRWLVLLGTFVLASACTFEPPGSVLGQQVASPDAGGMVSVDPDAMPAAPSEAETFFVTNIVPFMGIERPKMACIFCHESTGLGAGPKFFGANPAENYTAVKAVIGLIGLTPDTSRFYLKGDHAGDALSIAEEDLISQWIILENTPPAP